MTLFSFKTFEDICAFIDHYCLGLEKKSLLEAEALKEVLYFSLTLPYLSLEKDDEQRSQQLKIFRSIHKRSVERAIEKGLEVSMSMQKGALSRVSMESLDFIIELMLQNLDTLEDLQTLYSYFDDKIVAWLPDSCTSPYYRLSTYMRALNRSENDPRLKRAEKDLSTLIAADNERKFSSPLFNMLEDEANEGITFNGPVMLQGIQGPQGFSTLVKSHQAPSKNRERTPQKRIETEANTAISFAEYLATHEKFDFPQLIQFKKFKNNTDLSNLNTLDPIIDFIKRENVVINFMQRENTKASNDILRFNKLFFTHQLSKLPLTKTLAIEITKLWWSELVAEKGALSEFERKFAFYLSTKDDFFKPSSFLPLKNISWNNATNITIEEFIRLLFRLFPDPKDSNRNFWLDELKKHILPPHGKFLAQRYSNENHCALMVADSMKVDLSSCFKEMKMQQNKKTSAHEYIIAAAFPNYFPPSENGLEIEEKELCQLPYEFIRTLTTTQLRKLNREPVASLNGLPPLLANYCRDFTKEQSLAFALSYKIFVAIYSILREQNTILPDMNDLYIKHHLKLLQLVRIMQTDSFTFLELCLRSQPEKLDEFLSKLSLFKPEVLSFLRVLFQLHRKQIIDQGGHFLWKAYLLITSLDVSREKNIKQLKNQSGPDAPSANLKKFVIAHLAQVHPIKPYYEYLEKNPTLLQEEMECALRDPLTFYAEAKLKFKWIEIYSGKRPETAIKPDTNESKTTENSIPFLIDYHCSTLETKEKSVFVNHYEQFKTRFLKINNPLKANEQLYREYDSFITSNVNDFFQLLKLMQNDAFSFFGKYLGYTVLPFERMLSSITLNKTPFLALANKIFKKYHDQIISNDGSRFWESILICLNVQESFLINVDDASVLEKFVSTYERRFEQIASLEEFNKTCTSDLFDSLLSNGQDKPQTIDLSAAIQRLPVGSFPKLMRELSTMKGKPYFDIFKAMFSCDLLGKSFRLLAHDKQQHFEAGKILATHNESILKKLSNAGIRTALAMNYSKQFHFTYAPEVAVTVLEEKETQKKEFEFWWQTLGTYLKILLNEAEATLNKEEKSPTEDGGKNKQLTRIKNKIERLLPKEAKDYSLIADPEHQKTIKSIMNDLRTLKSASANFSKPLPTEFVVNSDHTLEHFEQSKRPHGASAPSEEKAEEFYVAHWDKDNPRTMILGNDVNCCLGTGGAAFHAMVQRRMDDAMFFHVILRKSTNTPIALAWLYFGEDKNKPGSIYVVANFLEILIKYKYEPGIRDALVNALLAFTSQYAKDIGAKGYVINHLTYGSIPNFTHFNQKKIQFNKVGGCLKLNWEEGIAEDQYYLNSLSPKITHFHLCEPAKLDLSHIKRLTPKIDWQLSALPDAEDTADDKIELVFIQMAHSVEEKLCNTQEVLYSQFKLMQILSAPLEAAILYEGLTADRTLDQLDEAASLHLQSVFPEYEPVPMMDFHHLDENQKTAMSSYNGPLILLHLKKISRLYQTQKQCYAPELSHEIENAYKLSFNINLNKYPDLAKIKNDCDNAILLGQLIPPENIDQYQKFSESLADRNPEIFKDREIEALDCALEAAKKSGKKVVVLIMAADHVYGITKLIANEYKDRIKLIKTINTLEGYPHPKKIQQISECQTKAISEFKKENFSHAVKYYRTALTFWQSTPDSTQSKYENLQAAEYNLGSVLCKLAETASDKTSYEEALPHLKEASLLGREKGTSKYHERFLDTMKRHATANSLSSDVGSPLKIK